MGSLGEVFKLIGERHPVNQSVRTVVNLFQTRVLNKMEMVVLQKGLSFIPRDTGIMGGTNWNRLEAEAGLTAYHRRLKLADFFLFFVCFL